MHNIHRGGFDRPDTTCGAMADTCHSMVDMSDPSEVRQTFPRVESQEFDFSPDGQTIQFSDPYEASTPPSESNSVSAEGAALHSENTWIPNERDANAHSITEMTQLSEQMLPTHANGSYPNPADWEALHEKNKERAKQAEENGTDIVMFGDSITEAMGYNPANLEGFKIQFGSETPTPLGLGGDGTAQLLYRINHGEFQGHPKVAMVMIGTNDIGSLSPQQIADNTEKIIDSIHARSPNTKVLLMGVLPRPLAGDPDNSKVAATNAELSQLAKSDGSVQFADINRDFVDQNGREIPQLYQQDGLHLSPAGYRTWAEAVADLLRRILALKDGSEVPPQHEQPSTNWPDYSNGEGNSNHDGQAGDDGSSNYHGDSSGDWRGSGGGSEESDGGWQEPTGDSGGSEYSNDSGSETYHAPDAPLENPIYDLPPGDGRTTLDVGNIRGVNLDGADWGKWQPGDNQFWPTAQELDYYKSKGMNTVRLPISWEQFQPILNGPLDRNEMDQLHKFLQAAAERGIKVIPCLMNFDRYTLNHGPGGRGVGNDNGGTVVGEPGLPVSTLQDFWQKLVKEVDANETESQAIGGWDLMNEPYNTNHTWVNTATQVVNAIRATGDNHSIVIEGDQWARDFTGFEDLARSGQNIVFSAHSYWDSGSGAYDNVDPRAAGPNVGIEKVRPFVEWLKANNAKGFVGEWGVPTTDTAWNPAITNFIHYLTDNGVGNMVWSGGPGWKPDYKLSVEPVNGQDKPVMDAIEEANQYHK